MCNNCSRVYFFKFSHWNAAASHCCAGSRSTTRISRGHTRPSPCNQPGAHIHPSPRDQPWAHTALPSDALPPTPSVVTEPRAEAWLHCSLPLAAYLSADTGNDSQASQNNLRKKKKNNLRHRNAGRVSRDSVENMRLEENRRERWAGSLGQGPQPAPAS